MADIRKRKGAKGIQYQVRFTSGDGNSGYTYRSFDSLREAKRFIESGAIQKSSAKGSDIAVEAAVEQWLQICEREGLNGREPVTAYTLENYKYRAGFVTAYRWPKPIKQLTPPDIVSFRSWLLCHDMSRELASKVLSTLYSVLKEMTIRGLLTTNPAAGVSISSDSRYREPIRIPRKAEILSLLEASDRLCHSTDQRVAKAWKKYRPMLYLAVETGMRPQEYLALARSSLQSNGVLVERALDGDGKSISVTKTAAGRRFINVGARTLDIIRAYLENDGVKNEWDLVFPTSNGGWQSRRNWQRRGFDVACREAGLVETVIVDDTEQKAVKYRPYDLRHFYASLLIEKRLNLKKIQKLMGHKNIETTLNVYGHLIEDSEESDQFSLIESIN